MIAWADFNWEAFATLVTGLAAVAAATFVARRQAQIIERQVELQELAFRSDVFDRRASVYNAIRQYLSSIIYSGDYQQPEFELFERFTGAVDASRFLFSCNLHLEVKALDAFVSGFLDHARYASDRSFFRSEEEWDIAKAEVDRRAVELRRRFQGLPNLFESEMSLKVRRTNIDSYVSTMKADDQTPDRVGARIIHD